VNPAERAVRHIDRAQQGFAPAAFTFGVIKKFGDDRAGSLAALIAYYIFLTMFPLLLLLFTILGIVAGHNEHLARSVENSALRQFPVIGNELGTNIHALHANSTLGLVIGAVGLIWGSQGAIQAGQYAMAEVWNVPNIVRPNFWARLVRTLMMMGVLGAFLLLSTAASGFSSFAGTSWFAHVGAVVLALGLNIALYVFAFRVLTPKIIDHRWLVLGSVVGGVGLTVLQSLGTTLIAHELRHMSPIYGTFAVILGFIAWVFLGAQMTLYVAELNVVQVRRLWPRSIVQPPLTDADVRVLEAIGRQGRRRPEQRVSVSFFHARGQPEDGGPEVPSIADAEPVADPMAEVLAPSADLHEDPDAPRAGAS